MDPNANLLEQERIIRDRKNPDPAERVYNKYRSARLRELREALTGWIRGGGFEPEWNQAPNARKYYGR
jgi:hypothetical protein